MPKTRQRRAVARACACFLERLGRTGSVRAAADAAGVPRSSLYKWRQALPDFAAEWAAAWTAVAGRRRRPRRPSPPPVAAPAPAPAPVPASEWIEIPGQGRRHVSTLGRRTGDF